MKKLKKLSSLLLILTFLFQGSIVNASETDMGNKGFKSQTKYDAEFDINFDAELLKMHEEAIQIYGKEKLLEDWKLFRNGEDNNAIKELNKQTITHNEFFNILPAASGKLTDYYYSVKWINRSGVISLSIDPKPALYIVNIGNDRAEYERFLKAKKGWSIIVKQFSKSSKWKNTAIMEKQYLCHVGYGGIKRPWNIEPHRTSMNPIT